MKKVAALVMSALIVSSLSGCAYRNTGYRNRNTAIYPGTTQGTRTGYGTTNVGTTQGIYRDGVFTGEGDRYGNTNQTATVVISGGRITDITLRTIDSQGRDITSNTTGGTTGGTTGYTTGSSGNTAYTPGARYYNTPGVTTGGATGGMAGDLTGSPRGNAGYATGDYSFQNIGGNAGGMIGGTVDGTSVRNNTGYTTGTAGTTNYDSVRRQLAAAMINQQTADVALNTNDTNETRNWKLAVRRALDKARIGGTTGGAAGTTTRGNYIGPGANGGNTNGTTGWPTSGTGAGTSNGTGTGTTR